MTVQQLQSEIDRYKIRCQKIKLQCSKVIKDNKPLFGQTNPAVKLATDILRILNIK